MFGLGSRNFFEFSNKFGNNRVRKTNSRQHNPVTQEISVKLTLNSDSLHECQVAASGDVSHKLHEFNEPLRQLLGTLGSKRILLNLESATSIDSSGIRWLLMCRHAIRQARGELVLHSIPPCVAAPLRLLNLLPIFSTAESLKAALRLPRQKEFS